MSMTRSNRQWAPRIFRSCCWRSRAVTHFSVTATVGTGTQDMVPGLACCITRAMTSTTSYCQSARRIGFGWRSDFWHKRNKAAEWIWETACDSAVAATVRMSTRGATDVGRAYLELTGYANALRIGKE